MKIKCPSCNTVLAVPDSAAGKVVKCQCGKSLRAPGQPAQPIASAGAAAAGTAQRPRPSAPAGGFDPGIFDELSETDLKPVRPVSRPGVAANPYQSPSSSAEAQGSTYSGELASYGKRFAGAFVDQLVYTLFMVIPIGVVIATAPPQGQEPTQGQLIVWAIAFVIAILIPLVINAVMITNSGQSIGKKAIGSRIILDPTREAPGFLQGVLIRSYVTGILTQVVPFFGLVDILMIFGERRRCLHDRMAGTIVIDA